MKEAEKISRDTLEALLQGKVEEVASEPSYSWGDGFNGFMVDDAGKPVIRVAIANFMPKVDIWEGLRSPACVGLYPLMPADIWLHGAVANVECMKPDGSPNPFAMPETYEEALGRIRRAVVVSTMLVVNPDVYAKYAEKMEGGDTAPYDHYQQVTDQVWEILDRATSKVALALASKDRMAVPMTRKVTSTIIKGVRGAYTTGRFNGPCNGHWPQNSVAALTGLVRFGVSRLAFRDELGEDGKPRRLCGRFGSIVIFDEDSPVHDPENGITKLDRERLSFIRKVNDYAFDDEDVVAERFCTYNRSRSDGTSVCGRCIQVCPSGALPRSSPLPDGSFPEKLLKQQHRFHDGVLDFDAGACHRYHHQRTEVWEEFSCGRCEVVCAVRGVRKSVEELRLITSSTT